jgi:catechol 2,3-dioxygenase-like lactoylglutathione lyase family enzyme
MPDITGIAHVELSVRDLERSVAFYTQLLGARDVWRGSSDEYGIDACAIYEPKSKMVFALTCHRSQDSSDFSPRRPGLDHVSFGVADRAALEEWVKHLDELGIAHSPIQDNHQPPSVTLKDPDGIALEFSYPAR